MLRVELTPFAHSLSSEWVLQSWIAFECFCFYCANQVFLSKGTPCLSLSLCGLESGFQLGSDLTHKSADSLEKLLETCETRGTARWVNIKLYDTLKIWYAFRANHFLFCFFKSTHFHWVTEGCCDNESFKGNRRTADCGLTAGNGVHLPRLWVLTRSHIYTCNHRCLGLVATSITIILFSGIFRLMGTMAHTFYTSRHRTRWMSMKLMWIKFFHGQ